MRGTDPVPGDLGDYAAALEASCGLDCMAADLER